MFDMNHSNCQNEENNDRCIKFSRKILNSICPIHGDIGMVYKCSFCCNFASILCFGTEYLCNSCHEKSMRYHQKCDGHCNFFPHPPNGEKHLVGFCLLCEDENFYVDQNEENLYQINAGKISEGSLSITYKIIDKRTKIPMCKKVLRNGKWDKTIIDEFKAMHFINHPCICKAIGINPAENYENCEKEKVTTIALFTEFNTYKLENVLKMKIDNTFKTKIILDIAHAMKYIHKKGMIHRNLTVDNIMLNSIFETKLINFGLYKNSKQTQGMKSIDSLPYMSPEMINDQHYDNKTDVYSFGIILHFILIGSIPKQSLKEKLTGKSIIIPNDPKLISPFGIHLIENCLSHSPLKRPSFDEILSLLRENSYEIAPDVDQAILYKRDQELEIFENSHE